MQHERIVNRPVWFFYFPAIFQRTSVSRGQLRIQGVATCLYLCMDSCGLLYGSVSQAIHRKKLLFLSIKSIRSTPPTGGRNIPRLRKPSCHATPAPPCRVVSFYSAIPYRYHLNYRNAAGRRKSAPAMPAIDLDWVNLLISLTNTLLQLLISVWFSLTTS